jgi:hypothetical protein
VSRALPLPDRRAVAGRPPRRSSPARPLGKRGLARCRSLSAAAGCTRRTIRRSAATSTLWSPGLSQTRKSRGGSGRSCRRSCRRPCRLRNWRRAGKATGGASHPLSCSGAMVLYSSGAVAAARVLRRRPPRSRGERSLGGNRAGDDIWGFAVPMLRDRRNPVLACGRGYSGRATFTTSRPSPTNVSTSPARRPAG